MTLFLYTNINTIQYDEKVLNVLHYNNQTFTFIFCNLDLYTVFFVMLFLQMLCLFRIRVRKLIFAILFKHWINKVQPPKRPITAGLTFTANTIPIWNHIVTRLNHRAIVTLSTTTQHEELYFVSQLCCTWFISQCYFANVLLINSYHNLTTNCVFVYV